MRSVRTRGLRSFAVLAAAALVGGLTVGAPASADNPSPTAAPTPELITPWTADVSADNALPEYPRPQLVRPTWQNLNGEWEFAAAAIGDKPPIGQTLDEKVLVPYPIESALSGIKRHEDRMFYRRTFTAPKSWKIDASSGRSLLLHFGAVDYQTKVWVNGTLVANHKGGYDAFSADVTKALKKSGPQEVVVGVVDFTDPRQQPVGKQRIRSIANPGGIEYTPSSGIWQTVWIEPVSTAHVDQVVATTQKDLTGLKVRVDTKGADKPTVNVKAYDGTKLVGSVTGAGDDGLTLKVAKPHLWTPDDPHLYDLVVTLKERGRTVDTAKSYVGMRTIGNTIGKDGKQHIVLNGKAIFVNATLDQGFWPDGIYTAPTDEALKFDLDVHKDLGFNAVRKHIKVEPDRWYYWADKLGLMVWQDMPSLNEGDPPKAVQAQFEKEMHTMIDQHKGWTSIIGWVPFNEGWGEWNKEETGRIADSVKAQDPSRLVNAHSGVNCCNSKGDSGKGDVIDWHAYTGPATLSPTAERSAIDGEHGGFGLEVEDHMWHGTPGAYQMADSVQELTDLYVENQEKLLLYSQKCGLSGGIYTQITDVENEVNGFYTYDRQVQKMLTGPVKDINDRLSSSGNLGKAPADYPPGTPGLGGTHRYSLDEGTGTAADDAVGSADLTLSGDAAWTDGKAGKALKLNGAGKASTGATAVDTGGNYSVGAWVKLDETGGGFRTVVSQDGAQSSAFFLQYDGGANKFAFSTVGGRAYANTTAKAGQWYHLVGVRDAAAGTYTLYLDGEKQGVSGQCMGDESTGPLTIGGAKYNGQAVDFLRGAVDDVRTYDRALTGAEVALLQQQGGGTS